MSQARILLGAVYLGRPENREGVVWKFRTNPDRGRGSGLSKTGRPEKSKSPKNKYRNYSIMSNFTTVFTDTYYIKISGRYSSAVCYYGTVLS